MVFGLALVLALVFGVASMTLAGTGVGDTFNLGRLNAVNQLSRLVGSTDNPMLRIDNNSAATNATALDLQVEAGHAPLKVDSTTKVASLNADKLDGKDFGAFGAQRLSALGPLPEERTFTTKGGTLIIFASGSGFRGDGTSLKAGRIGMELLLDGDLVGRAEIYANERNSHKAFVDEYAVIPGVSAGEHKIRLEEMYHSGVCNTASEQPNTYCTDTDLNDYFKVTVVEIPD